jgi:hypothetical protein
MVHTLRVLIAVVATAVAFAVMAAAPAAADEPEYLRQLQDKFSFLSKQQLLAEGHKACHAIDGGMNSADVTNMVQKDLKDLWVSLAVSGEIVSTAAVELGC